MSSKLPNFLIVGAAKSGTTSLYNCLKQHPEIYLPHIKEPKFITAQFLNSPLQGKGDSDVEKNIIRDFDDYKNLFASANKEKAVGEASADNLYYYEKAIEYIKKYLSETKIIIILRNPAERAFSAYTHMIRDGREHLSFEESLEEEQERIRNNWEFIWHYKTVGFYSKQVEAYLKNFKDVKVVLLNELENNPKTIIQDIYDFLNVDPLFTPKMDIKHNISGLPKNKIIYLLTTQPNRLKSAIRPIVQRLTPPGTRNRVVKRIKLKNIKKVPINSATRQYLINQYHDDILRLQKLINKDLSSWLK